MPVERVKQDLVVAARLQVELFEDEIVVGSEKDLHPEPRQFEQEVQATGLHAVIVQDQ